MSSRVEVPEGTPAGVVQEVWVLGQPSPARIGGRTFEFPPYRVRWTDAMARQQYGEATALEGAKRFVAANSLHSTYPWTEGPRIVSRTVSYGEWVEYKIEEDTRG